MVLKKFGKGVHFFDLQSCSDDCGSNSVVLTSHDFPSEPLRKETD